MKQTKGALRPYRKGEEARREFLMLRLSSDELRAVKALARHREQSVSACVRGILHRATNRGLPGAEAS